MAGKKATVSVDWDKIERWIEDELLDEDEREAYRERRACLAPTEKEDKEVEEQVRRERGKQLAFYVEDEFAARVKTFCRENSIPIGEFCRKAIEAALDAEDTALCEDTEASNSAPVRPTRGMILSIAKEIVCADREETYGEAENNFGIIAEMWSAYLFGKGIDNGDILAAEDVAAMMILLKVSRVATGKNRLDNWVDIAGYAACGGECEAAE